MHPGVTMGSALPQTNKQSHLDDTIEISSPHSDSGMLSSSDTDYEDSTLVDRKKHRSAAEYLKQNLSTRHVSRRRAHCFRWLLAGSCVTVLTTITALIWLAFFLVLIRRLSNEIPWTGFKYIVDNWRSPQDSIKLLASWNDSFSRDLIPKPCHSHNDYWRKVPLFESLAVGCTSVEVDVWLPEDVGSTDLPVGHKKSGFKSDRTLESLYITPLLTMLQFQNTDDNSLSPKGIFETSPNTTVVLLLDMKSNATTLWPLVNMALQPLRQPVNYLRSWNATNNTITPGPLTIIATGEADLGVVVHNSTHRDIFLDAPLTDIHNTSYNPSNSYYASSSLSAAIGYLWFGRFSNSQSAMLDNQIATAANRGLISRYWETPSWPISVRDRVWKILVEKGVGILNVDDLYATGMWNWDWCVVAGLGLCG